MGTPPIDQRYAISLTKVPGDLFGAARRRRLTAGNRGDKHQTVAVAEGAGFAAEEANVFFVEVDVEELANLALVVADVAGKSGEAGGEVVQGVGNCAGATVHTGQTVGEAAERGRNFDGHRHFGSTLLNKLPKLSS